MKYSFGQRMDYTGGRASGFDYMRLILAATVVLLHSFDMSYGQGVNHLWVMPLRILMRPILPMFFALSGFLVAGSLERNPSLVTFLGLRIIRIYPALAVEVLLSAFVIGPLLTTVPLSQYFTDPLFFHYLINVTGHISYVLPGLFVNNPYPNMVNVQLWTVRFELMCYVFLSALAILRVLDRRILSVLLNFALMGGILTVRCLHHAPDFIGSPQAVTGPILIAHFLAGVTIYLYRKELPWNLPAMIGISIVGLGLLAAVPFGEYICSLPIAYMTVGLGLTNPARLRLIKGADYSYGIFLYGAVIQQCVAALFPWSHEWWINFAVSMPFIVIFAAASWILIEKPALGLRTHLAGLDAALRKKRAYFTRTRK